MQPRCSSHSNQTVNMLLLMKIIILLGILQLFSFECSLETFNVRDFGAKGDGKTLDLTAIQKTFEMAQKSRGGIVLFPSPGIYLTGAFNLTSNTKIVVEKEAVILGVRDKQYYPIIAPLPSYGQSREGFHNRYQPLVFGVNLTNVEITGKGTIDGQGEYWWDLKHEKILENGRPRLVEFLWSKNIEISDVTMKDAGFWTLHPTYCDNVYIHDVLIVAQKDSPNTGISNAELKILDGIDPDSSSNVLIERCNISVSDDHIAVKSGMDEAGRSYNWPIKNLTVRDCNFYMGSGISIGSETSGGIFDVYFQNIKIHNNTEENANRGLFIKSSRTRGGTISNINYEDIVIEYARKQIIEIDLTAYGHEITSNDVLPVVKNVYYKRIKGTGQRHGKFTCIDESRCHNIVMEDIATVAEDDWECEYAYGSMTKVDPNSCLIPE